MGLGKPMTITFYDLSVPTFLQTVKAVGNCLARAERYCAETGADPEDFVHARLFDDMAPFHFQIEAARKTRFRGPIARQALIGRWPRRARYGALTAAR